MASHYWMTIYLALSVYGVFCDANAYFNLLQNSDVHVQRVFQHREADLIREEIVQQQHLIEQTLRQLALASRQTPPNVPQLQQIRQILQEQQHQLEQHLKELALALRD